MNRWNHIENTIVVAVLGWGRVGGGRVWVRGKVVFFLRCDLLDGKVSFKACSTVSLVF